MYTLNATEVRKNWSAVSDRAIREKPQLIKRTRDYMVLSSVDFIRELLSGYRFSAEEFVEDDGSVTLSLNEFDIAENAPTEDEAKEKLAAALLEYAHEFYDDFEYWSKAPNRKSHIPYVFKALMTDDTKEIKESIVCRRGKT